MVQIVKNLPAVQETWVWSLGWEDTLEEGMATQSSILAWRSSWTEEPGGLQCMASQGIGHDWVTNTFTHTYIHIHIYVCIYIYGEREKQSTIGLPRWYRGRICLPMQEMYETRVQSQGRVGPLEKSMATHSSVLAWRISWTEETGRLQSME